MGLLTSLQCIFLWINSPSPFDFSFMSPLSIWSYPQNIHIPFKMRCLGQTTKSQLKPGGTPCSGQESPTIHVAEYCIYLKINRHVMLAHMRLSIWPTPWVFLIIPGVFHLLLSCFLLWRSGGKVSKLGIKFISIIFHLIFILSILYFFQRKNKSMKILSKCFFKII